MCLRNFGRAHKGWTLLKRETGRSRHSGQVASANLTLRTTSRSFFFLISLLESRHAASEDLHRFFIYLFDYYLFVCVCAVGANRGRGPNAKCNRRALRRLRCKESKLAPHLGCRSHRWKMPTVSPSSSSGKTRALGSSTNTTLVTPEAIEGVAHSQSVELKINVDHC